MEICDFVSFFLYHTVAFDERHAREHHWRSFPRIRKNLYGTIFPWKTNTRMDKNRTSQSKHSSLTIEMVKKMDPILNLYRINLFALYFVRNYWFNKHWNKRQEKTLPLTHDRVIKVSDRDITIVLNEVKLLFVVCCTCLLQMRIPVVYKLTCSCQ